MTVEELMAQNAAVRNVVEGFQNQHPQSWCAILHHVIDTQPFDFQGLTGVEFLPNRGDAVDQMLLSILGPHGFDRPGTIVMLVRRLSLGQVEEADGSRIEINDMSLEGLYAFDGRRWRTMFGYFIDFNKLAEDIHGKEDRH